jgi:hypothetical protein
MFSTVMERNGKALNGKGGEWPRADYTSKGNC